MSLSRSCRLFGISRQAFYQRERRKVFRTTELTPVKNMVQEIRRQMPRVGTRKLYYLLEHDLRQQQIKLGRDGLFDLLRAEYLLIKPLKRYTKTTNSKHWLRKYPNLMKDQKPQHPEQYFVSDITYVKSKQSVHYLSLVTDAYSRKIMGYHLSDDMTSESVVKALKKAIKGRIYANQTIHHSDRGLQYCSMTYQKALSEGNIIPSMTDGYDCYQNALAERVNGILKQEFLINKCNTKKELELLVKESVDIYNNKRPHLSLNMMTPNAMHKKASEKISKAINSI